MIKLLKKTSIYLLILFFYFSFVSTTEKTSSFESSTYSTESHTCPYPANSCLSNGPEKTDNCSFEPFKTETGGGYNAIITYNDCITNVRSAYDWATGNGSYEEYHVLLHEPCYKNDILDLHTSLPDISSFDHHLKDSALDNRRQDIADNQIQITNNLNKENFFNHTSINPIPLYSAKKTINTLKEKLSDEKNKSFLLQKKSEINQLLSKKYFGKTILRKQIIFIDKILDGTIITLLQKIEFSRPPEALNAFKKLCDFWPWKNNISFLMENSYSPEQETFIAKIGIDIMIPAEMCLMSRQDFLYWRGKRACGNIKNVQKHYIKLQKTGNGEQLNTKKLLVEKYIINNTQMRQSRLLSGKLVALKALLSNPLTHTLSTIAHADLHTAQSELCHLKKHLRNECIKQNIFTMEKAREQFKKQYGYDVLKAAHKCYSSRPDYCHDMQHQSLFSDYQNKKNELDTTFEPINVQQNIIELLNSYTDTISFAHELKALSNKIFAHVSNHGYHIPFTIELQVDTSIGIIKIAENPITLIFHIATVDHLLADVQSLMNCTKKQLPSLIQRSPELLVRAVNKFITELNPIEQAKDLYHLANNIDTCIGNCITTIGKTALTTGMYPKETIENICQFIINTAHFISDTTIGISYLPDHERQKRITIFWEFFESLSPKNFVKLLSAEQIVDFVAQTAANVAFFGGIGKVATFLKEVDAISTIEGQASKIAQVFKKAADKHLIENPTLITAEGIKIHATSEIASHAQNINKAENVTKLAEKINNTTQKVVDQIKQSTTATIVENLEKSSIIIDETMMKLSSEEIVKLIIEQEVTILDAIKKPLESLLNGNKIKKISDTVFKVRHTFSKKHVDEGIFRIGSIPEKITKQCIDIIKKTDLSNRLTEGTNTIRTYINNIPVEIHAHIEDNSLLGINFFSEYSKRKVSNLIEIF